MREIMLNKSVAIYALVDCKTDTVRYVGATTHDPERRLRGHLYSARVGSDLYVHNWIRKSGKPKIVTLEVVSENGDWQEAERKWIRHYRELGIMLTNLTGGGEGAFSPSESTRAKKSAVMKGNKHLLGHIPSEETRAKISAAGKGRKHSAKSIALMCEKQKGHLVSKETKLKIGAAHKDKVISSESKAKMSASQKLRHQNFPNPMLGRTLTEEHKQKCSAALKGRVFTEEHKERIRQASLKQKHSEETKAELSLQKIEYYKTHDAPFKGRKHTDEAKKLISDAHKGKPLTEEHKANITKGVNKANVARDVHPLKGVKRSQEIRDLTSKRFKGKKQSPDHIAKRIAHTTATIAANKLARKAA